MDEKPKLTGRGGPGRGQGRKVGQKQTDIARQRIRTGYIISRFQKHLRGECELTPTQVRVGEILLRKALPDLTSTEHTGEIAVRPVHELTDAELTAIAAGRSAGALEAPPGEDKPRGVH